MTPLTVACVFVKGPYPYTAEYVHRLLAMVQKHLPRPFRFVCLTDQPWLFCSPIETIQIAQTLGSPESTGYWTKLRLFDKSLGLTGRVLFLDLDVLIVASLDPIVDVDAPLALTEDAFVVQRAHVTTDRFGRTLVRRFNSSVMVWTQSAETDRLFDDWTPAVSEALSGDQDWIGQQAPDARALPLQWFPRLSVLGTPETWPASAKVILAKKPKNVEACERWPWFNALWRAA